ncbi:MAG TPA: TIGR04190 family B12-binding domain/radical SAM domain protein [Candidatus Limnocylindria bacterium]
MDDRHIHDLVLIHAPSVFDFREREQFRAPTAQVIPSTEEFEMYPMGMTSIASYLVRNNYRVRIVNLARRMVGEPGFDAVRYLRRLDARVFGIDLHWLPHAHGALAVARLVKRLHPRARVLIGGLSASYFHDELMREPAIDFVIAGDSTEEPCRQLLQALREHRPLASVANLSWKRDDGHVVHNGLSYVPTDLDAFDIPAYGHMLRSVAMHGRLADALPYEGWLQQPLTVLLNGRGCVLDCAICGGSRSAYRQVCARQRPAFRSPERLIEDVRVIRSFSRSPIFVIHDPRMGGRARMRRFFELLERERVPNEMVFELFSAAREDLFELISKSLRRWSLQVTIETQEERLRAKNGKFGCTNGEVEETIATAFAHGCHTLDLFFMVGIPGQTHASALGIGDYCEYLMERFGAGGRLRPFVAPLAPFLDPGSRAFEDPEIGYRVHRRTLADHEEALLAPDWGSVLTFETDAMTRDELVDATYAVTARINDLNLRYGLTTPSDHDAVVRGLRAARRNVATHSGRRADRTWLVAKDEMSWSGPKGIRPSRALAWMILGGLKDEAVRAASRAIGRYDVAIAAGDTRAD